MTAWSDDRHREHACLFCGHRFHGPRRCGAALTISEGTCPCPGNNDRVRSLLRGAEMFGRKDPQR